MIAALDSSIERPSLAEARAAGAAGVGAWGGYLPPGAGLESPWDRASFQIVQAAGLVAIGFASGNDDPAQVAATARAWGVLGCLDDEDGIRATAGGWQQPWLDASGFGRYGLCAGAGVRARFHIVARYPGSDPGTSWDPACPRPPTPLGWQWQGTHSEFGLSVDRSWLDDWFGQFAGGEMQRLTAERPDGGDDVYVLDPAGQLHHTVRSFLGVITFRDEPPGIWSSLIWAGYRDLLPVVQGYGTDLNPYEITDPGSGWTAPVPKP